MLYNEEVFPLKKGKYRLCFWFQKNPEGRAYEELIELMFNIADSFILVDRLDMIKNDTVQMFFEIMASYLIMIKKNQYSFAGTLLGKSAIPVNVYYYKICNETKEILLKHTNSLYEWIHPNLPEDLTFYINNKSLLVSTAHEMSGCIYVYDRSIIEKIIKINGLELEITYASGPDTDTEEEENFEVQNEAVFLTFEDAIAISDCAANAKYISYQDSNYYVEYEFKINEVLYGDISEKTIYLFTLKGVTHVDTIDYNYNMGEDIYTPGDDYILIMSRTDLLFYDHPRYMSITDIYMPLKDINKSTMYDKQIAEIVESSGKVDKSTLVKNIKKQNNSKFKNHKEKYPKYSKSDKLSDIVTEADLILKLKIDKCDSAGIFNNGNSYICTVLEVLKGGTIATADDGTIFVSLIKNSVKLNESYVIMLNKTGEDSTIYVQSSKKSIISANDSKTINEIKQIID